MTTGRNPIRCVEQKMVCESVDTMVVHSSCEKFCSKEEQKIEEEVTADLRTWGEGGEGGMCGESNMLVSGELVSVGKKMHHLVARSIESHQVTTTLKWGRMLWGPFPVPHFLFAGKRLQPPRPSSIPKSRWQQLLFREYSSVQSLSRVQLFATP